MYIVWVAVKNAQTPNELAANAAREAPRYSGALNYLDRSGEATRAFAVPLKLEPRLGIQLPAWDVYLAYSGDARWMQTPPAPAYWMHQLSNAPAALRLDGDKLRSEIEKLLTPHATAANVIEFGPQAIAPVF